MKKVLLFSLPVLIVVVSGASAQTVVRVPFVRVETGGPGGTYVRAPFVNIFVPGGPAPVYFGPPPIVFPPPGAPVPIPVNPNAPPPMAQAPFPVAPEGNQLPQPRLAPPQPLPEGPAETKPADPKGVEPPVNPDLAPPAPVQPVKAPTISEFAKSFQAKAGNYEVTLTSPVTGQPETVRFSLPGDPQRTEVRRNGIEFVFGPRRYVRIEFDRDGPMVISR